MRAARINADPEKRGAGGETGGVGYLGSSEVAEADQRRKIEGRDMSDQMHLLGFAITGKEFVAMDDLKRVGIDHWRGVRIEFERRGKQRAAEAFEYPALHNYVWLRPYPAQMRHLSTVRFLGSSFHFLSPASVRQLADFRARVDQKEAASRAIIVQQAEAMQIAKCKALAAEGRKAELAAKRAMISAMLAEYVSGDQITIREGILAGEMATFRRMVQGAHDVIPYIEAEMQIMGRVTPIKIDPLSVRRAPQPT